VLLDPAVPLFGVRPGSQDRLDQLAGLRPDGRRPAHDARRCPLGVLLVGFGHVLDHRGVRAARVAPGMGGDALAEPEDLDGRRGEAHVDGSAVVHQGEGDRVVVAVDFDVVVDVDTGDLPLAVRESRSGQRP